MPLYEVQLSELPEVVVGGCHQSRGSERERGCERLRRKRGRWIERCWLHLPVISGLYAC